MTKKIGTVVEAPFQTYDYSTNSRYRTNTICEHYEALATQSYSLIYRLIWLTGGGDHVDPADYIGSVRNSHPFQMQSRFTSDLFLKHGKSL